MDEDTNLFSRMKRYYQKNGLLKTIKRCFIKPPPPKEEILNFWDFIVDTEKIPYSKEDAARHRDGERIVNWIVPEFEKGSGGHINIFRFISALQRRGIHNRVYVYRAVKLTDDEKLHTLLKEHFPILDPDVESFCDAAKAQFAHATVATSWITAYFVRNFENTWSKFYFIQDFEPYFYAHGSEYWFAENTYTFGFRGITAGDWLKDLVTKEYGMRSDSFSFSYDRELYHPVEKTNPKKRVFFYARPVTPRRDWEIGLLALNRLYTRMPDVEVVFAGWDVSSYVIPFPHENLGVVELKDLSALYASCDLCLIISSTNLSLLPLEVMGAGSVAVCSVGENSTWLVNEENSVLVEFDPNQIADTLEDYLTHPEKLQEIRRKGIAFAQSTSWEREADKVYAAILKGIEEDER